MSIHITERQRAPIAGQIEYLAESFDKLLNAIDKSPELARLLYDHELLALMAWTGADEDQGENQVLSDECRRRHDHHQEQELRFAAFGDQLALIADLPDDMPWTEARGILAERLKRS